MKRISEQEFEKLPKKAPTFDLKPGKFYYIRNPKPQRLNPIDHDVYIGRFKEKNGDYFDFENIEILVSKHSNNIKPFSVKSEAYIFMEVIDDKPTSKDIQRKKENIEEIIEYIRLKRAEPHDETPTVSFFGKDYRKAKERFEKLQGQHENKSKSPKTQSKGGRMSRRKANKNYTRKQRKQRKQCK